VRRAFEQAPESHRCNAFIQDFQATKKLLCELTGSAHVALALGSGTLANDMIGGQLSLAVERGLVISNGEFGQRLIEHSRRWRLQFDTLEFTWGEPVSPGAVCKVLEKPEAARWIWCTHCETSTGVLNDVQALRAVAEEFQAKLCLDCISSIGTLPVDLS